MAEDEPSLAHPATHEMAVHTRDYSRFIAMFKWGAILSFITAFLVLLIIS